MLESLEIFEPVKQNLYSASLKDYSYGHSIKTKFDHNFDLSEIQIGIIGVPEERRAFQNIGTSKGADSIREYFYKLINRTPEIAIADFGNLVIGNSVDDTYVALSTFIAELIAKKVFVIILGGSNDLAFANYLAYEKLKQIINITAIDARFDLSNPEQEMNSQNYLNRIIMQQPNFLFNYTNIGYQSYFVDNEMTQVMKKLFFDTYRLGYIRENIEESEVLVRNADMLSVDISCVRQSEAPGNGNCSPNGFYGEEICRIMRYAGMNDKLTSAGFYEINPLLDNQGQTAHLTAQMIWYLIEGISFRKNDIPKRDSEDYVKYHVFNKKIEQEFIFYKSKKTGRWWMEVEYNANENAGFLRHYLVACTYNDYLTAANDEIPDRLWLTYQKIM